MFEFILSTGQHVDVDLDIDLSDVTHSLKQGVWFTDEYDWAINPAHVVAVKDEGE